MREGWIALILLAILQGATEFLPISSSGHLILAHAVLEVPAPALLFDIVLHVGTLAAVVLVYRRDIAALLLGLWRGLAGALRRQPGAMATPEMQMVGYLLVGTFATAVIGFLLKDYVESVLRGPRVVGIMLLINGGILWASRYRCRWLCRGRPTTGVDLPRALLIGVLQGLAVTPGISRSGTTITGALVSGVEGEAAARFSFLLSIPAILGALALHLGEVDNLSGLSWWPLLLSAGIAGVVGYFCVLALVRVLRGRIFYRFSWYCWGLGAVAIVWSLI